MLGQLCQLPKLTTLLWNKNRIYFLRPLRNVWLTTAEKLTDLFDFFISCACFCLRIFIKFSSSIIVIRRSNSHSNTLLFHLRQSTVYYYNYRDAIHNYYSEVLMELLRPNLFWFSLFALVYCIKSHFDTSHPNAYQ